MKHFSTSVTDSEKHFEGGAVAIVALFSPNLILLIKEPTKRPPIMFKLLSETFERGEPILNAVCGALSEEAGMGTLRAERDRSGKVERVTDARIKRLMQLLEPEWLPHGRAPHWRHVWGALTTDEIIKSLAGKVLEPEDNERLETHAIELAGVTEIPDLLPAHREILEKFWRKK